MLGINFCYSNNLMTQLAGAVEYTDPPSPPKKKCSGYDTKQSDNEALIILEHCGMWSTPLLPLLPGPLCSEIVAPDWLLSMCQIELNCLDI